MDPDNHNIIMSYRWHCHHKNPSAYRRRLRLYLGPQQNNTEQKHVVVIIKLFGGAEEQRSKRM